MANRRPHRSERVTIQEVAQHAGVSAMTVSNVLNRTGKVGKDTADRVRTVVAELGYTPNSAARQLTGARATAIGLLFASGQTPFLEALLVSALKATASRGMQLLIADGSPSSADEALSDARDLIARGADALLLVPPYPELLSGTDHCANLGIPLAAIAAGHALPDMSTVRIDNRGEMRKLVNYLIARGHHRIGFLAGPQVHADARERLAGYREALNQAGIQYDEELVVEGRFNHASGEAAAASLLSLASPPTAIAACNDDMAAGVLAVAHQLRIDVPRDLAVTGFDDTLIASRVWPPLTVIRQPFEAMAAAAMECLFAGLENPKVIADRELAGELIQRASA